jgi:predicted CoA-binding protein
MQQNCTFRVYKEAGYQVFPINPHLASFKGDACYPGLKSLPQKPQAVFLLTSPAITEQVVRECVDLGVSHVWMHCMMGTKPGLAAGMTSVSSEAVKLCRENGIKVIPGSCPNQFIKPDPFHGLMRSLWSLIGFMPAA